MSALTASSPFPAPASLPDGYARHRPDLEAQRVVLCELVATHDWARRSWPELDGLLAFASGAGLLDRALVPVWLGADTHVLVDLDLTGVPVDTTLWRTAAMTASRTHQVDLRLGRIRVDLVAAETRSVAAEAVRRILAEAKLVTGPAGLALDEDHGHAVADLELYTAQHSPDGDALLLGDPERRP